MATQLINIFYYPDIRHHTYSFTHPSALLRFSLVSHAFNQELSDEFFKQKCEPYLSTLKIAPCFYDPLMHAVENPWKLMCFCLTEEVLLDYQNGIVQRVANNCQENFKDYLTSKFLEPLTSALLEKKERMQAICGAYYQDPKSPIDQAWQFFKENWTEQEERTLDSLERQRAEDRVFQDWIDNTVKLIGDVSREEIRHRLQKKGIAEEAFCRSVHEAQFDPAIAKQVNEITGGVRVAIFPQVMAELEGSQADPRAIQMLCLARKKFEAEALYKALESERQALDGAIKAKDQEIAIYREAVDDPELFKEYTERIMCNIVNYLIFEPRMVSIKEYLAQGSRPQLSQEEALVIQKKINFLPQGLSAAIWEDLYWECANGIDEWGWSENHFQEYPSSLNTIVKRFLPSTQATENPVADVWKLGMLRNLFQGVLRADSR